MKIQSNNFKKFLSFSFDFNHTYFEPTNNFLILGKKKNLNLYFLNPELIKNHLKNCFFFFQKSIELKNSIVFIGRIDNESLLKVFTFFCAKNKLVFIDMKQKNNTKKYRMFLKKKNIIFVNLFLNITEYNNIQKDAVNFNIPLINFLSLQHSKYNSITSFNGLINYDYIQFLIILTLINIYEKI